MGPDREPQEEETQVKLKWRKYFFDWKSLAKFIHCRCLIFSEQAEAVTSESEGEIEVAVPAGEEGQFTGCQDMSCT